MSRSSEVSARIPVTPPHVSVNRVRIVDLPGLPIDDEVRDQQAHHLLSSAAVIRYARERAEALKLPAALAQDSVRTRLELPRFVSRCLDGQGTDARVAAQAIGRRLGRNLGHILLALHRGDPTNRAARPDWTASDWDRWAAIKRVWIGGGLVSGRLGKLIVHQAQAFLAEIGYGGQPQLALTPHPEAMALLGAGRYVPPAARCIVCLDFGHTLVKRACLDFEDGVLIRLHRHAPILVNMDWLGGQRTPNPTIGRGVLDFVTDAIVQTLDESAADGMVPDPDVMLSVAAYAEGGRLLGNGLYATLSTLAGDVRPLLAQAVAVQIGRSVRVHLIHDGTAASALYAGQPDTAVIIVGTALGVGFPPPDAQGLRPLAADLEIV